MNDRIRTLLNQITALENDMHTALQEQQTSMFFQIKGKRIEFGGSIRQAHLQLKKGFFRWLVTNRPQNPITEPVIYIMIVPLLILDLCMSFYQAACLPPTSACSRVDPSFC